MKRTTQTLVSSAAAVAAAGLLAVGASSMSSANAAADTDSATATVTEEGSSSTDEAPDCGPGGGGGPRGERHEHTEVTGEELTTVTEAVSAQDGTITVEQVRKDPDGSYDVLGTRDGEPVMVEVSSDLGTVEVREGGPGRGGHGRPGTPPGESDGTQVDPGQETEQETDASSDA